MAAYTIDNEFLQKSESFSSNGYVPSCTKKSIEHKNPVCSGKSVGDAIGKSGMTIGTGVDLGQMNEYDLKRLKLPEHIKNAVTPYLGKRGNEAQKMKLQMMPIDARILSDKVKDVIITVIVNKYEKDSGRQFNILSVGIQTAVVNYFYQYGQNSMRNSPHSELWKYVVDNDWENAVNYLKRQVSYAKRRNDEASLISSAPEYQQTQGSFLQ